MVLTCAAGAQAQLIFPGEPELLDVFRAEDPPFTPQFEPYGAEERRDADNHPRIPEPMVFDLVRPLGARRGEFEMNVLALIPLTRRRLTSEIPDSIGLVPTRYAKPEWAPEVELAIADGLAVEFELPFEEWTLAAYKAAAQVTFGTAFEDRFIHGGQGILLYDRHAGAWSPTLLYIAGFQFNDRWSVLGMAGLRAVLRSDHPADDSTETLFNLSVFRHVSPHSSVGIETNTSCEWSGPTELLLMPQWHWEISEHWMLQTGAGCRFGPDGTIPEAAFRLIRTF